MIRWFSDQMGGVRSSITVYRCSRISEFVLALNQRMKKNFLKSD